MTQANFRGLPFAIVLEICSYLDVESLVAMADVNKDLRNLSLSYKSYWLPPVLQEGLLLPLPQRPLVSFSPFELSTATRRAVFRERNMSLEKPMLYSCNRIAWPYARQKTTPGEVPIGENLITQDPLAVCSLGLTHDNGEWHFMLSGNFKLRVVHLRTGILVLEEDLVWGVGYSDLFASDFVSDHMDDLEARISTITPCNAGHSESSTETPYRAALVTCSIALDPHLVSASITIVARVPLTIMPRHLALAGKYALLMENTDDEDDWPGYGELHLVDWMTGERMKAPPLLTSISVVGYPDYFISVGINAEGHLHLQVLGIPLQNRTLNEVDDNSSGSYDDTKEDSTFVLSSIPIHPGSAARTLDKSDDTTWVCHEYTGRTINTIRIWIRDGLFGGCFTVFSIPVDFGKPPDQWFTPVNSPTTSEEGGKKEEKQYIVDHKKVTEKLDVNDCIQPGTLGKRFIWWKSVTDGDDTFIPTSQTPGSPSKIPIRLRLFSSDITCIPSFSPKLLEGAISNETLDSYLSLRDACWAYPTCELECPFDCEIENTTFEEDDPSGAFLFSVITVDRSGTVVVTLVSGDILVLRFGHP